MQTYLGHQFWPLDPRPEDIHLEDIAHALSNLCRFGGMCRNFYSVADHSVHVAELARAAGASVEIRRAALLHDAAEAYLVDLPRPIKHCVVGYKEAETRVERCIEERFGLPSMALANPDIKAWDGIILATESRDLMTVSSHLWEDLCQPLWSKIVPMTFEQAKRAFLAYAEILEIK